MSQKTRQRPRDRVAVMQPEAATLPVPPVASPTDKIHVTQLLAALEGLRNSRVLAYWTSDAARLSEAAVVPLFDQLETIGHVPRLDLFLSTRGGDTEAPWRVVSLVREYCDHFAVVIPHRAMSAGTLVALGADEIVMTPLSALGPIDPSRSHPLLPSVQGAKEPEPISVQDMRHAMEFVRRPSGAGSEIPYTPEAMAQIFAALFDKIHPLAIGAIQQTYALAKLVARMCLETHMDPAKDRAQIDAIVDRLCDDYKSHSFQITRKEAVAIGLPVTAASPEIQKAINDLWKLYMARPVFPRGTPTLNSAVDAHIAWLDSTALNLRVEGQFRVQPGGKLEPQGDAWKPY